MLTLHVPTNIFFSLYIIPQSLHMNIIGDSSEHFDFFKLIFFPQFHMDKNFSKYLRLNLLTRNILSSIPKLKNKYAGVYYG